jgi:DNA-binding beta-propeller fold protein YncE
MWRLLTCLASITCAVPAQTLQFQHLFTLGSKDGLNPTQKFAGRYGRLAFGKPERPSPVITPDSVTVDPDERVWITDRGAACVHIFDIIQSLYRSLRGTGDVDFQCPSGIASDIHGRIYVADACLAQVFVFEKDGTFMRSLLGKRADRPLLKPGALAVSHDLKTVYVADPPRHKVVVFNQEGETVRELGGEGVLSLPQSITLGARKVFVLDTTQRTIEVFSPDGTHLVTLKMGDIHEPSAFAFDPELKMYFVGEPRYEVIMAFGESGSFAGAFGQSGSGPGELHAPSNLYVDGNHRVYVVDPRNAKVLVFGEAPGRLAAAPGPARSR